MSQFNLYAPINFTGYGTVARGIIKGLQNKQVNDFFLSVIGQPQLDNNEEVQHIQGLINQNRWNRQAPAVALWHEFDLAKFSSNKLIAFPLFETTKFNTVTLNYLNQMDVIFVLSHWARDVVNENLNSKIPCYVVPGASDAMDTEDVLTIGKNNKAFTFFTVGKLEKRKAHAEIIQAYVNAFSDKTEDDTRLICHCFSSFEKDFTNTMLRALHELELNIIQSSTISDSIIATKGNAIVEIPKAFVQKQQLFQLYKYCHVGVFPSKGEGWNLPLMESIKMGTPCIASNYSAHTEYLTEEYNYPQDLLLNKHTMETAQDGIFFAGDRGEWAAPNMDELTESLLYTYNNYDKIIENFDNTKIKETFTWDNTASKLLENISKVE